MNRAHLTSIALLAPLALINAPDLATAQRDAREYTYLTGLVCQPPAGHAGYLDYRETGVGNVSTSAFAEVFCPTVEVGDNYDNGLLQIDWLEVGVIDARNTGAVSCYMYGSDFDRNTIWSPTRSTTTADPPSPGWWTGNQRLFFDVGATAPGFGNQRMSWSLRCYLPPSQDGKRSWVKQILVGSDIEWEQAE